MAKTSPEQQKYQVEVAKGIARIEDRSIKEVQMTAMQEMLMRGGSLLRGMSPEQERYASQREHERYMADMRQQYMNSATQTPNQEYCPKHLNPKLLLTKRK